MRSNFRLLFVFFVFFVFNNSSAQVVPLNKHTRIVFASVKTGQEILGNKDDFVSRLSGFDRSARLKTDKEINEAEYLAFVASSVRGWQTDFKTILLEDIKELSTELEAYSLSLPDTIFFILTSGEEEGGATYSRQNAIIFPQKIFMKDKESYKEIILHELFHVWSRTNPDLRKQVYSFIGFQYCGEIELPGDLKNIKITNPDAPRNDYFIKLQHGGNEIKVVPILYSKNEKYDSKRGGEFFNYLVFAFLAIDENKEGYSYKIVHAQPLILTTNDVSGYFDQIGNNTNYIIHPEEILADNFALMMQKSTDIKTPELIQTLEGFFQAPNKQ